jgi:hypothetical protein
MLYDDNRLCAENIFSDRCPLYAVDLRDYLRTNTHIAFFIRASPQAQTDFENLRRQLNQDRMKNPLLAWYPANCKRPILQKGMYLKPEERPAIEALQSVYAHFDWIDYLTK